MSKLNVNAIEPSTGTDITLGASGDTITVPSGATFTQSGTMNASAITAGTLAIAQGGTGAATLAAAGLSNVPAFFAYSDTGQGVADNTTTKIEINTEIFDSGDYDATTNYRFLPTTAGKYFVYGAIWIQGNAATVARQTTAQIYKNGSAVAYCQNNFNNSQVQSHTAPLSIVLDMNGSSDYAELFGYYDSSDGSSGTLEGDSIIKTYFGAYKLIGA
jgi:hypothetical protein